MKWLGFSPGFVQDDGVTVRVALSFLSASFVTSEDGWILDGIRRTEGSTCLLAGGSLFGARFGVNVVSDGLDQIGGALATVGAAGMDTFTMANPPPGTPGPFLLGANRWLWGWAPVNRLSSFDLEGGDFQLFAPVPLGGPALAFTSPVAAGSLFLFKEYDEKDGGTFQGKIAWSDGVKPPATYLQPPSPDDDYGSPAYAHTHVGFLKGIGRKDVNSYDSVELWASPFSGDPEQARAPARGEAAFGEGHVENHRRVRASGSVHLASARRSPGARHLEPPDFEATDRRAAERLQLQEVPRRQPLASLGLQVQAKLGRLPLSRSRWP